MDKIFKQLYPGVKEEYLERAFEKLKKSNPQIKEHLPYEERNRYNKVQRTATEVD